MPIIFAAVLVFALWVLAASWRLRRPSFAREAAMSGVVAVIATLMVYSSWPSQWVRWLGVPVFVAVGMLPIGLFARLLRSLQDAGGGPAE